MEIPPVEKKHNLTSKPKLVTEFGFVDQLGCNLPPGYTEPSTEIDENSCAWAMNCRDTSCVRDRNAGDKYDQVGPFLRAFFIHEKHRADLFLSNKSMLFLPQMLCVYCPAAAVSVPWLTTEEKDVWSRAMELRDGPLALSYFSSVVLRW